MKRTKVPHRVPFKKKSLKIEIAFNFIIEIPVKFTKEFHVKFTGDFFYKYVTFRLILKKSYQEGVFDFFYPDPQLFQIFKPTRNLSENFFNIYLSLYIYIYI